MKKIQKMNTKNQYYNGNTSNQNITLKNIRNSIATIEILKY